MTSPETIAAQAALDHDLLVKKAKEEALQCWVCRTVENIQTIVHKQKQ